MNLARVFLLLALAYSAPAQNVYCMRAIGHTPFYERIFLEKGNFLRPATLRGVDDLGSAARYLETNRTDRLFLDPMRERTNRLYVSCLPELPSNVSGIRCPGGLISFEGAQALLQNTVAVPRSDWIHHMTHAWTNYTVQTLLASERYVFSLTGSKQGEIVVDLRPGSCALVYYPDDTYRCIAADYSCLKIPQRTNAVPLQR